MKFKALTAFILLSLNVHADVAQDCLRFFEEYATDASSGEVSPGCLDWGAQIAHDNAWRMSSGSHFKSLSFENVISYQDGHAKSFFTAGPNTQLAGISAVTFKESVGRIYALLGGQGRIVSYDLEIAGNVAPKSVLALAELEGALDLCASESNDEIYILTSSAKEVLVLDGSRNAEGRKEVREMKVIKRIELPFSDAISLALDQVSSALVFLKADGSLVDDKGAMLRAGPSQARSVEWSGRDNGFLARSRGKIVFKVGR